MLVLHRIVSLKFVATFGKIVKLWLLYSRVVRRLLTQGAVKNEEASVQKHLTFEFAPEKQPF